MYFPSKDERQTMSSVVLGTSTAAFLVILTPVALVRSHN
jgi:hypothetical protein